MTLWEVLTFIFTAAFFLEVAAIVMMLRALWVFERATRRRR